MRSGVSVALRKDGTLRGNATVFRPITPKTGSFFHADSHAEVLPRLAGSLLTRRWREADSNSRSPGKVSLFEACLRLLQGHP
jgi:hypothetical protein